MKKLLFLFCFYIWSSISFAQTYHAILGETNQWVVVFSGSPYDFNTRISCTVIYYTNKGDSIIASKHYKQIFATSSCGDQCRCKTGFVGLIREDTINRKVYYLDEKHKPEILIYDFSLNNGDSMYLNIDSLPLGFMSGHTTPAMKSDFYTSTVSSVKTYYGIGEKLTLNNKKYYCGTTLEWVEGLGSMKSPLYFLNPPFTADGGYPQFLISLTCAMKDNIITLGSKACGFLSVGDEPRSQTKPISVHLTPTSLSLWLKFPFRGNCTIRVYDILGNCKFSGEIASFLNNQEMYRLDFPTDLQRGVYLISISNMEFQTVLKTINY